MTLVLGRGRLGGAGVVVRARGKDAQQYHVASGQSIVLSCVQIFLYVIDFLSSYINIICDVSFNANNVSHKLSTPCRMSVSQRYCVHVLPDHSKTLQQPKCDKSFKFKGSKRSGCHYLRSVKGHRSPPACSRSKEIALILSSMCIPVPMNAHVQGQQKWVWSKCSYTPYQTQCTLSCMCVVQRLQYMHPTPHPITVAIIMQTNQVRITRHISHTLMAGICMMYNSINHK